MGTQQQPKQEDFLADTFGALSKGFSLFASKATEVAKIAAEQATTLTKELNENVIKPTTQKIQETDFNRNFQTTFSQISKTASAQCR